MTNVSKKFGGFLANNNISLDIEEGIIHALVGENGAGKSTLTKLIYGIHQPTSGNITIKNSTVRFTSPRNAIDAGIGMVHQHFMLAPELSVTENIMLGNEQARLFQRLPLKKVRTLILKNAANYGLEINPDASVGSLSIGQEQRVEILRLLLRNSSIMIFDEPTAVLTPLETDLLFTTLRSLRDKGKTILLITHKLDEVLAVADMVSVMRKGEVIHTMPTALATKPELAKMMVGHSVLLKTNNSSFIPGEIVLAISKLGFRTLKSEKKLDDLTLTIKAGEIYGIAGVEGNGQSELLQVLTGLTPTGTIITGEATFKGESLIGKKAAKIRLLGISHIPENRLRDAVILDYPVSSNFIFGRHREHSFHKGAGFNHLVIKRYVKNMISEYDIRCTSPDFQQLRVLSGGNQQKIVIAREFSRPNISLLILAQPTRGVDIGAIEMIHKKIIDACCQGVAVLLVSSELEEIIALSTRIACIYKGSIRHEFTQDEVRDKRQRGREFMKEIGLHIT